MQTVKITCDQCFHDLTYTGNAEDWRLVIGSESMAPWFMKEGLRGGAVTSLAKMPPVSRAHHFCGIPCLAMWMDMHHANAKEQYAKLMKHREWLAEKSAKPTTDQPSSQ